MNILITGANGYLGRFLIKHIRKTDGVHISAIIRPGTKSDFLNKNVQQIIYADLTKQDAIHHSLTEYDCVYHLAAATSGSHFEMMMNTVVATENLLKSLSKLKTQRFVLVSSFSVYQMTSLKNGEILDENCKVETFLQKRDSYSITKVLQEKIVIKECKKNKIPYVIIRPGKIYGPGDNPIPPQLGINIPGICFLYVNGNNLLPLTNVANCAEAIFLSGQAKNVNEEIFNIVDDNLPTQKEFIKLYTSIIGKIPRLIWLPSPFFLIFIKFFEYASKKTKGNIPPIITKYRSKNLWGNFKYSNSKAKRKLNWAPKVSIDEGLKEMFSTFEN